MGDNKILIYKGPTCIHFTTIVLLKHEVEVEMS
jgi:hypothetical protein